MNSRLAIKQGFIGVIAIVLGGCMVAPSAGATSSFHFPTDTIAATKKLHDQTGIWTADLYANRVDTNNLHLGRGANNPVWSPDGRIMAYCKDSKVYVSNKNGHDSRLLSQVKGYKDSDPVWSADGATIAFTRTAANGRSAVYVVKVANAKETNISGWSRDTNYRSPSWSPGGDRLAYETYSGAAGQLVIKTIKTGGVSVVTDLSEVTTSADVAWSPNGKKILFKDSSNEIYTIWPDGSHRAVISDGDSYQASWSPSGDRMVFIEDPGDDSISISEKDGTVVWLPIQKGDYDELAYPVWSADEDKIAFTMIKTDPGQRREDLFVLDLKGGTTQPKRVLKNVVGRADWR